MIVKVRKPGLLSVKKPGDTDRSGGAEEDWAKKFRESVPEWDKNRESV